MSRLFFQSLITRERYFKVSLLASITLIITFILEFILTKRIGLFGAAFGGCIGYLLLFILSARELRRSEGNSVLNVNNCLKNSLLIFLSSFAAYALKNSHAARVILFFALVLIIIPTALKYKNIILKDGT